MRAAVLLVGDELLGGVVSDRNLSMIARTLAARGVPVVKAEVAGDELGPLSETVRRLCDGVDLLVISGGLGPTTDDLTRAAVAAALGVRLTVDEERQAALEESMRRRGFEAHEAAKRQAAFPEGAEVVPNAVGSAPGILARLDGTEIWVVPGVPFEAREMVAGLADRLPGFGAGRSGERFVATVGAGEVSVAQRIEEAGFVPPDGVRLAYLPQPGGVRLRLAAPGGAPDEVLDRAEATLRALLADEALSAPSIAESLVRDFTARGQTLATAESCTGGAIGARITDVPGSSSVYVGGTVVYSDRAKVARLGIDPALLAENGAVSEPVARALAEGARERFSATVAVAVTGVAGPGGGTPEKPVGTVWLAAAGPGFTETGCHRFRGDRGMVRERTINKALEMAYRRGREVSR